MNTPRYTIDHCRELAEQRGGACLSRRYINADTKLKWCCARGHTWQAPWAAVHGLKRWCRRCALASPYTIEDMQDVAEARGGACLSRRFVNLESRLTWRCGEGHEWTAVARSVVQRTWCPACAGVAPWTVERVATWARARDGRCLGAGSDAFSFRLQCGLGHEWTATTNSIGVGSWCPDCGGSKALTLEDLQRTARERGGKCLAARYRGSAAKVEWECSKGHRWRANVRNVRSGSWCPECADERRGQYQRKLDISVMRKVARQRRGRCLSAEYVTSRDKLLWECVEQHSWWARPSLVLKGTWCPECAGVASPSIETVRDLARDNGFTCLSPRYLGTHTKLSWRCSRGHVFDRTPSLMKRAWSCPQCRDRKPGTLAEMHSLAAARGGTCASTDYVNAYTHLRWSCARGHEWQAAPYSVKRGSWCPTCARTRSSR